jgi:hypothetical protein
MLKLRSDNSFLRDTPIAGLCEFSKRQDPFLLHPSSVFSNSAELSVSRFDLPLSADLLKRIKVAERALNAESIAKLTAITSD